MLELQPLGPSMGAAAVAAVVAVNVDRQPSVLRQRVGNVVQSVRLCCNRECLASCRDRTVIVVKQCVPLFKLGVSAGFLAFGAFNCFVGFTGVIQGLLDQSGEYLAIGGIALVVGAVQLKAANKLMDQHITANQDRDVNDNMVDYMGASIGGVSSFYPATKIAELVMDEKNVLQAAKITRIAVGVLTQTASGVVIAGVVAVASILLMRGAIHLYYWAREERMRRNNPAAAVPLVAQEN